MSYQHKDKNCYILWMSMRARCNNKNTPYYKNYGGRGITVCKRWDDFKKFYEDMGDRPEGMTLDRTDNDKGYYPENCRWATWSEQHRNNRKNVLILYKGKKCTLAEISQLTGLNQKMLSKRVKRGWSDKEITNLKPQKNGSVRKQNTNSNH